MPTGTQSLRNDRNYAAFVLVAAAALAVVWLMMDRPANPPADRPAAQSDGFATRWLATTALDRGYVAATAPDDVQAHDVFTRVMAGDRSAAVQTGLAEAGFDLLTRQSGGADWTAITERPDAATGKGAYLIRAGGAPVLLQVPHRFNDLHTGTIAALVMDEHPILAAAWNTVPRWYDENGRRVDADLAHAAHSQFAAFGLAFAAAYPGGRIIQLHGFSHDRRTSDAGRTAGFIVSSGSRAPGRAASEVANCLRDAFSDDPARLYPLQVRELGGTTNTVGQALRGAGFDGFVHLEMSRKMRENLLVDAGARARLARCLTGGESWW